ncbi:MAG: tRNA (guanosine(37)-N1)-methyltransferase TrmD [Planctomycetes bacterium]|nr:tRNA (guanosine(37)-N1)-methyltransferase TrmD [Planctomycetota bacterium]
MRVDVITIFPEMFAGVVSTSIWRIAQEKGLLQVVLTDLREYTTDKHHKVDDRPFGGGPGMVLKVEPVVRAARAVQAQQPGQPGRVLLMCPQGRVFDQALARELAGEERLILIAPRYEGYDERIVEILGAERVSIGDYVLTGGELPAMVVIDAVARLQPGVLGDEESVVWESFGEENGGLLEYPQYTRPAEFEGRSVPEVLVSGDHGKVERWRREQARERTARMRPDLIENQEPGDGANRSAPPER